MEIFFGILVVILALISIVVIRNRRTIGTAINATMTARKVQKDLEKSVYQEAYNKAMVKEIPRMAAEKAKRDINKKLNKTPFTEKLAKMSEELTKDAKKGGREAKGLNSIIDDVNVFKNERKYVERKGWETRPIKDRKGKKIGFQAANTDVLGDIFGSIDKHNRTKKDMDFLGLGDFKSNGKRKKGKHEFWGKDF